MQRIRWGDNDRYWGPFTYSYTPNYKNMCIMYGTGKESKQNRLRMSFGKHTVILALPFIIKPYKKWVDTSQQPWSSEAGGYWDIYEREFGFYCFEGHLCFHYGRQTMDSSTQKRQGFFIPWTQWRHVRTSHYDVCGDLYYTEKKGYGLLDYDGYQQEQEKIEACPSLSFSFKDYDGEELTAKTTIVEREWKFGEGWFKWLSWFRRPKIQRTLSITFSGETGKRKGSWKGGTMGTGIEIAPNEPHASAFQRYCRKNDMTFGRQL